jgi:putative serine protease PepD
MGSPSRSDALDRQTVERAMHAVVQIVALRQRTLGNLAPLWTGSGTIVDSEGTILTNCHVANPRSMGMPAPPPDVLAIAITQRSDEPPALTYLAEIVAQSPELDLAVLRVVAGLDGRPVSGLDLPFISLGDSDTLELADQLKQPAVRRQQHPAGHQGVPRAGHVQHRLGRWPRAGLVFPAALAGSRRLGRRFDSAKTTSRSTAANSYRRQRRW